MDDANHSVVLDASISYWLGMSFLLSLNKSILEYSIPNLFILLEWMY